MLKPFEKLRLWRKSRNLTQAAAAALAKLPQPTWSDYESGKKCPRDWNATKIARLTKGSKYAIAVDEWEVRGARHAA